MPTYVTPSFEILECPTGEEALKSIELAARTCYKSEGKIEEGSAERLVRSLLRRGHHAMIEFGPSITVKFVSNRGFTHEGVRHRICSFGQESTRWCNYAKGKFNSEIKVCDPANVIRTKTDNQEKAESWGRKMFTAWSFAECSYLDLIDDGCPTDIAREVLPIGLKAEIVVKTNIREWRHIFSQRCSKAAHPRMREVMIPLLRELDMRIPVVFEDLAAEYCTTVKGK